MTRCLVTGAAGFLGSRVTARLLSEGHEVVAMVRHASDAARVHAPGAAVAVADLGDPAALRAAAAGAAIVCHCAAAIPGTASPAQTRAANVDGTARLLEAAVAAGVRRFVYVSTDSVYGDAGTAGATEDQPTNPEYFDEGDYPRSKLEGEALALVAAREHGLEVAIVRTCLLYGPGRSPGSDLLRRWGARRVHLLWGGGRARISMAFVTDAAAAVALAATRPEAAGRTYNLSDGEPHAWREIVAAVGAATGRPKLVLPLPGEGFLPLARAAHRLLHPWAPRLASRIDPRMIRFLVADHAVDIGRIRAELGYAPRVGLAEGVRLTLAPAGPEP